MSTLVWRKNCSGAHGQSPTYFNTICFFCGIVRRYLRKKLQRVALPSTYFFFSCWHCSYTGSLHMSKSATIHPFDFILGSLEREQSKLNFHCIFVSPDSNALFYKAYTPWFWDISFSTHHKRKTLNTIFSKLAFCNFALWNAVPWRELSF